MAVIKYNVEDVETGGGGVEPTPGLYPGKISAITHRKKKNDGTPISDLEVIIALDDDQYVKFWTYIKLPDDPTYDNAKWKLREFTDALGLPPKGGFDPQKLIGKPVVAKTKWRKDDPERAEIKNLFKPGSESVSDQQSASMAQAATEDVTDYSEWTLDDLKAEIEERGLEVPKGRVNEAKLIAVLEESDAPGDDDTSAAEEGGDGELTASSPGFYGDWSDQDLKDEITEKGIEMVGRWLRNKAIEALAAAAAGTDDGPEPDADADAPGDEYDTFTDDELKQEIEDRNKEDGVEIKVTGRWTREKAIEALRADDQDNPF